MLLLLLLRLHRPINNVCERTSAQLHARHKRQKEATNTSSARSKKFQTCFLLLLSVLPCPYLNDTQFPPLGSYLTDHFSRILL